MLYRVYKDDVDLGLCYIAWPRPDGEFSPVPTADRRVLEMTRISEFELQVHFV